MAPESIVDQIVKSLSFEVEATHQDEEDIQAPSTSNMTPLNVKIKVRKKHESKMEQGVLSVRKLDNPDGAPERIRGCLDPPFGEDKYSYKPVSKDKILITNISKCGIEEEKSNKIEKSKSKFSKSNAIKSIDENSLLNPKNNGQLKDSLSNKYSDFIITYPPEVSSSVNINEKVLRTRIRSEEKQMKSFSEGSGSFYSPVKDYFREEYKEPKSVNETSLKQDAIIGIPNNNKMKIMIEKTEIVPDKLNNTDALPHIFNLNNKLVSSNENPKRTSKEETNNKDDIVHNKKYNIESNQMNENYNQNNITSISFSELDNDSVRNSFDKNAHDENIKFKFSTPAKITLYENSSKRHKSIEKSKKPNTPFLQILSDENKAVIEDRKYLEGQLSSTEYKEVKLLPSNDEDKNIALAYFSPREVVDDDVITLNENMSILHKNSMEDIGDSTSFTDGSTKSVENGQNSKNMSILLKTSKEGTDDITSLNHVNIKSVQNDFYCQDSVKKPQSFTVRSSSEESSLKDKVTHKVVDPTHESDERANKISASDHRTTHDNATSNINNILLESNRHDLIKKSSLHSSSNETKQEDFYISPLNESVEEGTFKSFKKVMVDTNGKTEYNGRNNSERTTTINKSVSNEKITDLLISTSLNVTSKTNEISSQNIKENETKHKATQDQLVSNIIKDANQSFESFKNTSLQSTIVKSRLLDSHTSNKSTGGVDYDSNKTFYETVNGNTTTPFKETTISNRKTNIKNKTASDDSVNNKKIKNESERSKKIYPHPPITNDQFDSKYVSEIKASNKIAKDDNDCMSSSEIKSLKRYADPWYSVEVYDKTNSNDSFIAPSNKEHHIFSEKISSDEMKRFDSYSVTINENANISVKESLVNPSGNSISIYNGESNIEKEIAKNKFIHDKINTTESPASPVLLSNSISNGKNVEEDGTIKRFLSNNSSDGIYSVREYWDTLNDAVTKTILKEQNVSKLLSNEIVHEKDSFLESDSSKDVRNPINLSENSIISNRKDLNEYTINTEPPASPVLLSNRISNGKNIEENRTIKRLLSNNSSDEIYTVREYLDTLNDSVTKIILNEQNVSKPLSNEIVNEKDSFLELDYSKDVRNSTILSEKRTISDRKVLNEYAINTESPASPVLLSNSILNGKNIEEDRTIKRLLSDNSSDGIYSVPENLDTLNDTVTKTMLKEQNISKPLSNGIVDEKDSFLESLTSDYSKDLRNSIILSKKSIISDRKDLNVYANKSIKNYENIRSLKKESEINPETKSLPSKTSTDDVLYKHAIHSNNDNGLTQYNDSLVVMDVDEVFENIPHDKKTLQKENLSKEDSFIRQYPSIKQGDQEEKEIINQNIQQADDNMQTTFLEQNNEQNVRNDFVIKNSHLKTPNDIEKPKISYVSSALRSSNNNNKSLAKDVDDLTPRKLTEDPINGENYGRTDINKYQHDFVTSRQLNTEASYLKNVTLRSNDVSLEHSDVITSPKYFKQERSVRTVSNTSEVTKSLNDIFSNKSGSKSSTIVFNENYEEHGVGTKTEYNSSISLPKTFIETITTSPGKASNVSLKSSLKNEVISLDIGFQSYKNEKRERILKTIDTSKEPLRRTDDTVTFIRAQIRPLGNDIRIPVDSDNELSIQIQRSKSPLRVHIQNIPQLGDKMMSSTISKGNKFTGRKMQGILDSIYEHDLIPLQKAFRYLKQDVDMLAAQQSKFKDKTIGPKRSKSIRIVKVNPKCCCWNKC
ncbi:unnamed protein product [Diatraea saccharalis]|uniref:Uncharacterized protein n=1 Tax=Diatraea saccharalis TaxID=40085 RepID=A0A9N9WBY1_9NEOP|nr:unnamed protein product [Diatraea saccharalis]